ncbi:hypothetical protein OSTOST_09529, partial [Ostertagia ostertagi]
YGNVAPRSFGGRLFVIGYGLIGIPFTLLAIADLGKFLSENDVQMVKGNCEVEKPPPFDPDPDIRADFVDDAIQGLSSDLDL